MGNLCSKGVASMHKPKEKEEEASEAEDTEIEMTSDACNAKGHARLIHMLIKEEKKKETEDGADKTVEVPVCSAKGGTMTIPTLLGRDSSDSELNLEPRWGPSQMVLYESKESSSSSCSGNTSPSDFNDLHNAESKELEGVQCRNAPDNTTTQQPMVGVTELLQNHPKLQRVQGELSLKARGKGLDPVLCSRVVAMVGLLNLFLDGSLACTWKKASKVITKSEGHGTSYAQSIRQWVVNFVHTQELPSHQHGKNRVSVLNDKALTQEIKWVLSEKAKSTFFTAANIKEVVSSPEMQAQFTQAGIYWPSISKATVCCWLGKLGWWHGRHQNSMYFDGHKWENVVEYRKGFMQHFKQYKCHFHTWDNEGNELPCPSGFHVPKAVGHFHLVLITHNESTFYQNHQCQIFWRCPGKNKPKPKGEGQTLIVSDFLTTNWGPLHNEDRCIAASFSLSVSLIFAQ